MKFHLYVRTFNSITGESAVNELRKQVGKKLEELKGSGKLLDGGIFVGKRGAYMLLEADSEEELFRLIFPMQDMADIELRPIVSFDFLKTVFQGS